MARTKIYTAHVNFKGKKHYIGCFPTKQARSGAMRKFRESQPLEMCPCGVEFPRPLKAHVGIQFCSEHKTWAYWIRYRYGLADELIAALLVLKPDGCFACGSHERLSFDHCHATGKARGWLCRSCNLVLGMVEDDVERLTSLILYLKGE